MANRKLRKQKNKTNSVYERKVSLIDSLSLQGASIEELCFFFNMSYSEMLVLMESECIDIRHRKLTLEKMDSLIEFMQECLSHLSNDENWSDVELSEMFNMSLEDVSYAKQPFIEEDELECIINSFKK